MKKKKIMHVLFSSSYSGAENVVCQIIDAFSKEYEMYYCSPSGQIDSLLKEKHINHLILNKFNIHELNKAIQICQPDIIHAHDYQASCLVALSKYKGIIISHLHNNIPCAKSWNIKTISYAILSQRFYKVIGVSNKILEEAVFQKKIQNKYYLLYNYVDELEVRKKADEFLVEKQYDFVFIGRLVEQKNPIGFIDMIHQISKKKTVTAVMIGSGKLENICRHKISEYHLEDQIDMVGFQENPFPYIKAAKVGIMLSKWEGFGLTAIEMMTLGKPVLNTGVGGLGEIFKDYPKYFKLDTDSIINILDSADEIEDLSSIIRPYVDKKRWKEQVRKIYEE